MVNKLKENDDNPPISRKIKDYVIYLIIFAVIVSLITIRGNYILAPPYAVSAYLVVISRNVKRFAIAYSAVPAAFNPIASQDKFMLIARHCYAS